MADILDRIISHFFRVPAELVAEHGWTGKLYLTITLLSIAGIIIVPAVFIVASILGGLTGIERYALPATMLFGGAFVVGSPLISYFVGRGVARFRNWARILNMIFLIPAFLGGMAVLTHAHSLSQFVMGAGEVALSGQFLWYFHRSKARFLMAGEYPNEKVIPGPR